MWPHHMTDAGTMTEIGTEAENVEEIVQETMTATEVREEGHPTETSVAIEAHAGMCTLGYITHKILIMPINGQTFLTTTWTRR